ncbi:hypothetical protein ACVWYI_001207 [Bradyrhizobium sp. LB13.1]
MSTHQHGDEGGQREKADPLLEQVGRQVRQEEEIADTLAADHHRSCRVHIRNGEQVDKPLRRAMRLAQTVLH